MLKKGQPGWYDNRKPDTAPAIEETIRVPHKNKGKKRFGIFFRKRKPWRYNWYWTYWYHTEHDRKQAAASVLKKDNYINKYYDMEFIER